MNRFRKLGMIEYNGGIEIHSSLLNIVLHGQAYRSGASGRDGGFVLGSSKQLGSYKQLPRLSKPSTT